MPQQSILTKVRTGCRTCKLRKVKCDEGRPTCARCTKAHRKCSGYGIMGDGHRSTLALYRPQQLTAHDAREGRAFHFFAANVAPVLAGFRDSFFWTHLVMQFSHFAPAVRHAVLSISSLYEEFQNGRRVSSQVPSSEFAIKHYAASINLVKTATHENVALLSCILYLCVEYLLGDIEAAAAHCRYGITMLNKGLSLGWVREYILPIFRRLSTVPKLCHPPAIMRACPLVTESIEYGTDDPFIDLDQAEIQLNSIETFTRQLEPLGRSKLPQEQKETAVTVCLRFVEEWARRVVSLKGATPPLPNSQGILLYRLCVIHEMLRIRVNTSLDTINELVFDNHIESFKVMVAMVVEVVRLKSEQQRPQPAFTFEEGFLPAIAVCVHKCRDLRTRVKALDLMVQVAAPKEGPLDVGTLYRAGVRVIEIEHGISIVDCYEQVSNPEATFPLPSLESRVDVFPTNHQIEAVKAPSGEVSYRRALNIVSRGASGERLSRIEYITDKGVPPRMLRIPTIRGSRPLACT